MYLHVAQNFPYMTREDFHSRLRSKNVIDDNDVYMWLNPRDYRGVNKVWQVFGEKHKKYRRFGVVGGWRKKWFIICHCIDKNGTYQTQHFESVTGNDRTIEPIWNKEIHQWIFKHTGETFAGRSSIMPNDGMLTTMKSILIQTF